MKIGLFHSIQWPEGTRQEDRYLHGLEHAVLADELGYESVWLTEHHFSRHGIISDTFSVLAHLAARTKHVRLGAAVAVLPFHDPVRLAESAATVDLLSGGRLDMGIGRGYQWSEFHGFRMPMEERQDRFDEAIDLILRSWHTTEPFTHQGRFWSYEDINPQPKPLQSPHPPIWVATDNDSGFRQCVKEGWGVMLRQGTTLRTVEEQVTTYRRVLEEAGVAFDPAKLVLARAMHVAEDGATAWKEGEAAYAGFVAMAREAAKGPGITPSARNPFETEDSLRESVLFGDPDSCRKMLERIEAIGVQYVICFTAMGDLAHERVGESLRLFAGEVIPQLQPTLADIG